jgi:hypothetical protein
VAKINAPLGFHIVFSTDAAKASFIMPWTALGRILALYDSEPQIMLRFLDADTQGACGCPWPRLSLPLHTLAELPSEVETRAGLTILSRRLIWLQAGGTQGRYQL